MAARIPQTPEEQAKLKRDVIGLIRAVLMPEKHGVPLERLNREYRSQMGETIPWVRMGYRTLEDFVDQNPQLCRIQFKPDGTILVHAVQTEETKHIKNMVSQQRSKKRASRLQPARRPFNTPRWTPPAPQMPFIGFNYGQVPSGRIGGSNRQFTGGNIGAVASNRISGVQYNRRFPQSGGSGRFVGGSSGTNTSHPRKPEYVRSFPGQAQKLRIPNMSNNNQNFQQTVRTPKQSSGMVQQPMNNANRRNINQMGNNANTVNMNTVSFRPLNATPSRQTNGNLGGIKSPTNANMNNISRNNNNFGISNSKVNYEQYKPLLKEYFRTNDIGVPEYKTASLETKNTTGQNGSQGGKGFKSSKSMTRYVSTVKVKERNYQTFPQDFATSEAAEEAAAKLACLQLYISKDSLLDESSQKNSQHSSNEQLKDQSSGRVIKSQSTSTDTDFGEWIPPSMTETAVPSPSDGFNNNDFKQMIDRIVQLVGTRTNGVWSTQIDVEYSRTFKGEKLQEKWPDQIEKTKYGRLKLRVDRPIPGRCIILPNLQNNQTEEATSVSAAGDSRKSANRSESGLPIVERVIEREEPRLTGSGFPLPVPISLSNLPCPSVPTPANTLSDVDNIPTPTITSNVDAHAISRRLSDSSSQIRPPSLHLPEEELWDVYITHVHNTMNVCLRLLGDEYSSRFDDLVTNMELHYFNCEKMPSVLNPIVGKLYAAMVDGEWHRVEVTHVRGINISCYFIDHGDEEVLTAADLKDIDSKFLSLAPQAKHVRLAGLEDFRESTGVIADLTNMALGRSLVGNVHINDNDGVSLVLWDTSGDNEDININQTLLDKMKHHPLPDAKNLSRNSSMPSLEELSHNCTNTTTTPVTQQQFVTDDIQANPQITSEIFQHNKEVSSHVEKARGGITEVVANNSVQNLRVDTDQGNEIPELKLKDLMSMDLSSFKPLKRAVVPDADDFFDVTVTLAGSPSNFTVQPYLDGRALERLQSRMNEFYNNENNHYHEGPLNASHLSKDLFFAGRHDDGTWYRVKVNSMLDEYSAAVKLVDYGDYSMMQLENMQPLWPHFRNLEMQAISASLAGIVATHGDWTPGDAVWFTTRVVNKQFVSKIKDVIWDMSDHDTCGNGFKLCLSLFDTTNPNEDVVIEKLLVAAERAVYLCV